MAHNATLTSLWLVMFVMEEFHRSTTPYTPMAGFLIIAVLLSQVCPTVEAQEPLVLKPTIPIIGHIIGLVRHQGRFLQKKNLPAATLPMLNGKMYAVWEPSLIQALFRHKSLRFIPFAIDFAQKELNFNEDMMRLVKETDMVPDIFGPNHSALSGQSLHRMNRNALAYISDYLDANIPGSEWLDVPNLYLWLRDLMTLATSKALYGPGLFMENIRACSMILWARVQKALSDYYGGRSDLHEDASEVVRARASNLRRSGVTDRGVGQFELALLHVATAKHDPDAVLVRGTHRLQGGAASVMQKEIGALIEHQQNDAVMVDITRFEEKCPLLVSCYRETLRFSAHGINTRRVMEAAIVSDGQSRSFLLKKGCDVEASELSSHSLERIWGAEAMTWRGDRLLNVSRESEKARRIAYHPFGGGRHLCPGRNFAMAENLGFVAALVMGFDVVPAAGEDATWALAEMKLGSLAEAAITPIKNGDGFGFRPAVPISRKAQYQDNGRAFSVHRTLQAAQGIEPDPDAKAKDLNQKAVDDQEREFNEGFARRKQSRRPWHRAGSEAEPPSSSPDPTNGDKTRGRLLTTPTRLLKLILPLPVHADKADRALNDEDKSDEALAKEKQEDIQPLALLIHPHQPLSYLERLLQAEVQPINDGKVERPPAISFRAEADLGDQETTKKKPSKKTKKGQINATKKQEGNVSTYSGLGHDRPARETSEANWVKWSSSTEIGDFIRDAARGREFAVAIEGYDRELRVAVPSFNDRTYYMRVRLRKMSRRIESQAKIKSDCDELAHKAVHRIAQGGFAMLLGWWGTVYYVTFHTDAGWDLVEPVTYLVGLTTIMGGYMWFLYVSRELSYKAAMKVTLSKRQEALYAARGFNYEKWESLVDEANALRREIKMVANEYDVDWDEMVDLGGEEVKEVLEEEKEKKKKKGGNGKKDEEEEEEDDDEVDDDEAGPEPKRSGERSNGNGNGNGKGGQSKRG
ncbi:hypothetical protein ACHAQH_009479 [Verticillium albo-atrum]